MRVLIKKGAGIMAKASGYPLYSSEFDLVLGTTTDELEALDASERLTKKGASPLRGDSSVYNTRFVRVELDRGTLKVEAVAHQGARPLWEVVEELDMAHARLVIYGRSGRRGESPVPLRVLWLKLGKAKPEFELSRTADSSVVFDGVRFYDVEVVSTERFDQPFE